MSDRRYQCIYLSPHLDDAVLSCGGRIYRERQAGLPVLVLTPMAGDTPPESMNEPFVAALHNRWGLGAIPNPVAARRAEDREALSKLGADGLCWEWPDCIYRRHPQTGAFLYHSEASLFGPLHPTEQGLIGDLARRLARLPLASGGQVYVPLAVGGHIDHHLVRLASETWNPAEAKLIYYEDYPYAERSAALEAALADGSPRQAETVPLDENALLAKTSAVACYRSQISTFFANEQEIAEKLRAYATVAGEKTGWAERYWHRN